MDTKKIIKAAEDLLADAIKNENVDAAQWILERLKPDVYARTNNRDMPVIIDANKVIINKREELKDLGVLDKDNGKREVAKKG